MKKMKLYTVLKLKTRLIGELNRVNAIIQRDNSLDITRDAQENKIAAVKKAVEERKVIKKKILAVKAAIAKANIGIYAALAEMEEFKNDIASFYPTLRTANGEIIQGYANDGNPLIRKYVAFLEEKTIDELKIEAQKRINELQDEVDEYNATTFVEVDFGE